MGFFGGIGSLVGGFLGGNNAPAQSGPSTGYVPQGNSSIDTMLQGLLTSNNSLVGKNNPYSTMAPQLQQVFQSLFNNPGAGGYQSAGNAAGGAFSNLGNQGSQFSNLFNSTALSTLPQAQSVANMGLDPQKALYGQQLQQTNDQANVANAQYGLTGQQAAGNVNQADQNFNTNWENQQLQRALQGLSGLDTNMTAVGGAGSTANTVGNNAAGQILAGGSTPYGVNQTVGGNQETALLQQISNLLGPSTSSAGTIANLADYLGMGTNASAGSASQNNANYYAGLTGGAMGSQTGQAIGSMLGNSGSVDSSLSSLSNYLPLIMSAFA